MTDDERSPHGGKGSTASFRSPSEYANGAVVGLGLQIAAFVVWGSLDLWQLSSTSDEQLYARSIVSRQMYGWTWLPVLATYLATAGCFLRWKYIAYRNLPSLGVQRTRTNAGYAVGSYFIPILNLFRPFMAMKDIWNGSLGRASAAPATLVSAWWFSWMLSRVLDYVASSLNRRADTTAIYRLSCWADAIAIGSFTIAAALAIWMILAASRNQLEMAARTGVLPEAA